jgi:hypothetical protein
MRVRRAGASERWRYDFAARALACGGFAAAALAALIGATAAAAPALTASEETVYDAVAGLCGALALVSLGLAVAALRSGLVLDAVGITGRGIVMRRRLRWRDIAGFRAGVEELAPNKPSAVVHVKLVDGRWRTLPGTRVEGWLWNIDRHRRTAAAVAAALERERLRHAPPERQ